MFKIKGAEIIPKAARCDETVEIPDESVFQGVGEADMDMLLLQDQLPFDVNYNKPKRDTQKTEGCVERVDSGKHCKDFFNVKSPKDVDEKDDAKNRK